MKPPRIRINGVDVESVVVPERSPEADGVVRRSIGLPRQDLRGVGEQLLLTLHPLTAAKLYFDGVLPVDRATPIALRVGRAKASRWRISRLETVDRRGAEYLLVFTHEAVAA
jgi:hypothetical protein